MGRAGWVDGFGKPPRSWRKGGNGGGSDRAIDRPTDAAGHAPPRLRAAAFPLPQRPAGTCTVVFGFAHLASALSAGVAAGGREAPQPEAPPPAAPRFSSNALPRNQRLLQQRGRDADAAERRAATTKRRPRPRKRSV